MRNNQIAPYSLHHIKPSSISAHIEETKSQVLHPKFYEPEKQEVEEVIMTEDFQAEVCGENWWNPSRNIFGSSPCLSGINPLGEFGTWLGHEVPYIKARSSEESGSANQPDYDLDSGSRITGFGLSPPTESDWNGALMYGTRSSEPNHPQLLLQEDQNSSMNFGQEILLDNSQIHKDWSPNNFSTIVEDSFTNSFQSPDEEISSKPLNSFTKSTHFRTTASTLPSSLLSFDNGSFSSPVHGTTFSEALHTLFGNDTQSQQLLCVNESMDYNPMLYEATLNEFSVNSMTKLSSDNPNNYLELSTVVSNGQSASQQQFVPSSANYEQHNPIPKLKAMIEEVHGLGSGAKKFSSEQIFKRPRIEAPTSLPTFKVRKEKLGDRVTALQQLVSPFGKTDTASVLHEAVEYIKFLHNQVNVLSSPYLKNGLPIQRLQSYDKKDAQQVQNQDLKSRGLCVVPISSTFPVAAENTTDFWTPNFGGTLR